MNARACSAHPAAKRAPAENGQAPTTDAGSRSAFTRTLRALDWLNFFLADVQTGVGPFLAIYLAGCQWDEERVGLALTVGGIAGVVAQTPAGALVDLLSSKRALVASGVVSLAMGAMLIALFPSFWPVMAAPIARYGFCG
jgi:MFS family permease